MLVEDQPAASNCISNHGDISYMLGENLDD